MNTRLAGDRVAAEKRKLVDAINAEIASARQLCAEYEVQFGEQIAEPSFIALPDAAPGLLVYEASGLSAPNADGAVRSKAWDELIDQSLMSDHEPTQRWARINDARRDVFIQDTLQRADLTQRQRDLIALNCSRARFARAIGGMGGSKLGSWHASPLIEDDYGVRLDDKQIEGAFAVPSDLIVPRTGEVVWQGCRASDMAAFARNSLAHFIRTSGGATQPLTPWSFGAPRPQ